MGKNLDKKAIRVSIGKKIRTLREMKEMTQMQLATAIGMTSTGAISQIENGEKGIKLHAILRAADVLGVHPVVLLSVEDMDKDELSLMVDMMSFLKKKHRNPKALKPHFDAIKRLIEK
jgi:transcriptional regulator with XRE-family HTH domain